VLRLDQEDAMHVVRIPEWAIERVVERHGTAHPYADLDPARTALVVIDMQNGFMVESIAHALCKTAVGIVPNVNRLAAAVRRTGGKVVWIRNTYDPTWLTMHANVRPEKVAKRIESMAEGSTGHQLYPALDVKPGDMIVQKYRFSAFLPESSDLAVRLRAGGYDTVLIAGTVTNVCCESSARDAMMMSFKTVMVSDANAAGSDEEHNASLVSFYVTFGDVMDTSYVIERLEANTATRIAAE
jgi:ureidoacrylate peracid hydrolase